MPYALGGKPVVDVALSAPFNPAESEAYFREHGEAKYRTCKTKDSVVAESALRGYSEVTGGAEWQIGVTDSLPSVLEFSLLTIAELAAEPGSAQGDT